MTRPIPDAALDQPLCIVGTVGSGKTYAAKSAVEWLLREGRRVVIVDPTGVWHGLRTMADGSAGFPVVIFGGEQADVPVAPDAGAMLGALLADDRVTQAIVDVSDMTGGERTRFLTAMLERLYVGARVPRHLILDEADEMASQNPLAEQLRLLGIVDKIVRRGRVRGFRPMMITQRPAVLHKNVLSQIATLVAMRLTSPQDRKAIEGWVRGSGDLDEAKKVLSSLPGLDVGEGWVWAPREGVLERTRFPAIATLDTSATPETGAAPERPRAMAAVDVGALRDAMSMSAASNEGAKINTGGPTPSKTRTAGKKSSREAVGREISDSTGGAGETVDRAAEITAAEARAFAQGKEEGLRQGIAAGWKAAATIFEREITIVANLFPATPDTEDAETEIAAALGFASPSTQQKPAPIIREYISAKAPKAPEPSAPTSHTAPHSRPYPAPSTAAALNSAARKMLEVLDTNPPVRRSWQQVATLAGLKARGGHFNAGRKALVDAHLTNEAGGLVAIAAPSAGAKPEVHDPAALVEQWAGVLKGAASKILRFIFETLPRPGTVLMSREDIAHRLGMEPRGGHWNTGWKELRDNGLVIVEGGSARLSDLFDPPAPVSKKRR